MQILIIQPKIGMGDMIIYLPYIHAISKKYKKSVSVLVKDNSRAKELLADDNHINEIITLKKEMDGMGGIFKLSKELKKRNFDKIFIFNSSLRYNLIARLAGIKSIYQYPLFRSKDNIVHSAKIFTEDITNEVVSTEPNLIIKKRDNNLDRSFKHICLGISASGPTKRWNINNYIKLAEKINKKIKCKFYIAGGKNDIDLINKFKNSRIGKDSFSFEKMNIKETLQYISGCDLYIGNDTGWAHISAALNVKALTIFCDSPVAAYGLYSSKMVIIEPEGVAKGTTTHDTLGKDKVPFDEVYNQSVQMLN
jgi:heptosyltransferase II